MSVLGGSSQNIVMDMSSSDLKIVVGGYNPKTGLVLIEKAGIVPLETDENEKVASDIERYKSILGSHGVELNVALEYSAGDVGEFLSRAELFEQFADENLDSLRLGVEDERFYIHVHSVKSIAKGVGAGFLANLLETVELRKDDEFSKQVLPVIIEEFERVRKGFLTLIKEVRQGE